MVHNFPKVSSVYALPNYQLLVVFENERLKVYDCTPLIKEAVFEPLRAKELFDRVQVGAGGYGIVWTDEIDLSESELWLNGRDADDLPVKALFDLHSSS